MTNYSNGRLAENAAAAYLQRHGFEIIARNWRNRWCEIDIVASKGTCIYFVEVKYRQSDSQGFGLEYVTPTKLKQMHFAASFWIDDHDWQGEYSLAALEVSGEDYAVSEFIEEI